MPPNHCVPHTQEARAKMSASHRGKPCPWKHRETKTSESGETLYRCGACRNFYSASSFYRNKRTLLGLTSECRTCHSRTSIKSRDPVKTRAQKIKDQANRRAREQGLKISASDYRELANILGEICQRCGDHEQLQWDHVLPLSKGGLHHPTNIQRLCRPCNEKKQASCVDYRSVSQIRAIRKRWVIEFRLANG